MLLCILDRNYVNNEGDSNLTTFKELSNKRSIGVTANNKLVGNVLLFFLRMIINNNPDLTVFRIDDVENPSIMNISNIIKCFKVPMEIV